MIELKLAKRTIKTNLPAFVMGIVNATPDSFWEKSRGGFKRAMQLVEDGADILDIGGESSRPGSRYISETEEIKRVVPLIKKIRKYTDIPISVDTRKVSVMKAAFEAGADMLNDISALEDDKILGEYAACVDIPVILMHKRGTPDIMQKNTDYNNVFTEVSTYLLERAEYAKKCGIKEDKIIVDPGIGFGKNFDANFELIKHCGELCEGKYPVLMALSRKTCIGEAVGKPVSQRLAGTLAANLTAVQRGAFMIRVHDAAEAVDSLKIMMYT